jgi:hypothetical protein
MTQSEWLAEIGAAADDLGYGIESLEPGRVVLVARKGNHTLIVESHFLSGKLLRDTVLPFVKAVPVEVHA